MAIDFESTNVPQGRESRKKLHEWGLFPKNLWKGFLTVVRKLRPRAAKHPMHTH